MIYFRYKTKRYSLNLHQLKKSILNLLSIVLVILAVAYTAHVIKYPELYIPTLKTQLKQDIKRNDLKAIDYYQSNYLNKGIKLFD